MVSGPIVMIDTSEVREGKIEEVKTAFKELTEFVEANIWKRQPRNSPSEVARKTGADDETISAVRSNLLE